MRIVFSSLLVAASFLVVASFAFAAERPNIVLIYADDVGYGDVGCYGATGVETPNIDRLAKEGLRFTDGHSASATCTPSRYAMLTGEYAWRKPGTGIARGDANLIIEPGTTTLASILKQAGYRTGVVGKWHLGLGKGKVDWNGTIAPGPEALGFDYSFLIPATGDRVPTVYVENGRVVGLDPADPIEVSFDGKIGDDPTGAERPDLLTMKPSHGHDMTIVSGISRIGYMTGGEAARWKDEEMAHRITEKAVAFVEKTGNGKKGDEPFFLFFSLHDIHVPRVPHPRFVGKTNMGPRGDAIVQMDWCVGQILEAHDRQGLAENTIVFFGSDNGPVVDDGYQDEAVAKLGEHRPAGPLRGGKYSAFEGGTRTPFLVRWPAKIAAGKTSDALVCQVDFPASFATLVGVPLPASAAPDSLDVLPALLGESDQGRQTLVEHAGTLALRDGDWKLIVGSKGAKRSANTNTELGNDQAAQLYDLSHDLGETKNVAAEHPEQVEKMLATLEAIKKAKGSRPGFEGAAK